MNEQSKTITIIFASFFVIVFFFMAGFMLGRVDLSGGGVKNDFDSRDYQVTGDIKSEYKNVDVNLLWEIWDLIDKEYLISDVDGQELLYGAAKGIVSGLNDNYTSFLSPEETDQYFSSNAGEFEGIGTTLRQEGEFTVIESPIDGSPAKNAGLEPGDLILEVNGKDVQGDNIYEVAANIRGEAGSEVLLALYRPSTSKRFEVTIKRAKIDLDNIVLEDLGDGYYKIKIYKFTEESVEAFIKQWDDIVSELKTKDDVKGIVLDVRNNPGGYVRAVEHVLGEFLKRGTVMFSEEDRNGNRTSYSVTRDGKLLDVPVVVLTNEGSASASEILSGAMQDHDRAKVVGMETVGKGVEQKLITLSDGSTLQLVFQRWLTPDGKNISADDPIMPDFKVEEYEKQDAKALSLLGKE